MIRVTVELVPRGDESQARVLAQGVIVNDGTGTLSTGAYTYGITAQTNVEGRDPGIWKQGRIVGFKRKRDNVWRLLKRVLDDALESDG